ncbi:MAG: ABC transporter ATP-binding protein [Anaerolineales bacterium]
MIFLKRLWLLLRPYARVVMFSLMLLLAATALQLVVPDILRQVIDDGLARGDVPLLVRAGWLVLAIGLGQAVLAFGQRYSSEWIANRVGYDLRNKLYDHIQHLPFEYHDHTQTGQLISRCIEDVRAIERFTGTSFVELTQMLLLMIGIVSLLLLQNWRLALIGLLPLIPMVLMTTDFGKRISKLFLAVDNALGELSVRLQENVSGAQVVRAFAREPHEIQRFDLGNRALYRARITVIGEWSKIMPSTHFLVTLGTILILWFGGNMVLRGEMTIGEVVAFNSYLLMLAQPAQQLAWLVNAGGEATAGMARVFEVLDHQPEITSAPQAPALPPLRGRVTFEGVSFRYRGESTNALHQINLEVQPNQLVALIGPTGSGKTSLVNLIARFYDPTEGRVLVDGYDVRSVDLHSLRQQIGIVLQTSLLFSDTVAENIAYGRPDAPLEQVVAAAQAAQAHEFIMRLPDGYATVVGERGITLSGGQRQRVAIARALLMDPRILILDDSTSSVDTQTEREIQKALDMLMAGRTTFVIAHRLSTVRRADLILVMENGEIVERGTHDELLAANGLYREIYELQLRDQEALLEANGTPEVVKQVPVQKTRGME